ncbi:MAG: cation:proton antiporter [Gemmatimonadetes bacterium]|nr:cation:proton antiporter [Gemmatimonadota bacterium]
MADAHAFLADLAVVLGVAAITTYIFQRIRQPVVFGYLVAGMIVGPYLPVPLVADTATIGTLSELGVILLMFGLGLEFSLSALAKVGPSAGFVALVDTGVMFGLGMLLGRVLGWGVLPSVFAGAIVAISSTTIIVKAFAEQGVKGRVASLVFGILVFEDLVAIFLIAILTTLAAGAALSGTGLGATTLKLLLFLAAFLAIGLLVVPRLVRAVVRLGRDETTLVVSLGLCFGGALLAVGAGYSVALGAFIAGSLVAESGHAHEVEKLIAGVRDMFGAIFFVSVGMLIDPNLVLAHWGTVVAFTVVVVVGKLLAVSAGALLTGNGVRTSLQAAMSLTQVGEFAFIIAALGRDTRVLPDFVYPVVVAVSALTTLTTPMLIRASGPAAAWVDRHLPRPLQTVVGLYGSWLERMSAGLVADDARRLVKRKVRLLTLDAGVLALLIVGTSLRGPAVSTWLAEHLGLDRALTSLVVTIGAALLALPLIVGIVRVARVLALLLAARALPSAAGRLDYAAAPRRVLEALLHLAIVALCGVLVVAITLPFVPPVGPAVLVVLVGWLTLGFWRSARDLQGHTRAGAEVLLGAFSRHLARASDTESDTAAMVDDGRDLAALHRVLPGLGDPVPVSITTASPAAGRSLAALQLRTETGAIVLAITRGDEQLPLPEGHEVLRAGDVLALAGSTEAIAQARAVLSGRTPAATVA